jgi:LAO/AO transport system kinase
MTVSVENWAQQVRAGDVRAISRAVSAIENRDTDAEPILRELFPHTGNAYRIGITGAPGTGKSTLVDRMAAYYRAQKQTVGIIAVDPSSPFTGGSILGDRIRMQSHASDSGVFIRSMATRGFLGGLSQATRDTTLLLDAAGKNVILVETVGVGQGEIEVVRLADCTLVVLMPGMGDDVQNLKAGLMEIGDIFVLNKSDREGADRYEQQLKAVLALVPEREGWKPPVVRTVATDNKGIAELCTQIEKFRAHFAKAHEGRSREIEHWRQWILQLLETRLLERVSQRHLSQKELDRISTLVADRKLDPYGAVNDILTKAGLGEAPTALGDSR